MLTQWAGQVADFVRQNAEWAGPISFVLAFAESLAFISLLVPTTVMLIAVGALIHSAGLSFWEVLVGAALGASAGDWLSYWIGRRFGPAIATVWPLSRNPGLLDRGHRFFERWGMMGIGIGRFFGPLRASIPLVAGICAMPILRFQLANVLSAFLWSFAMLAPGLFGGRWISEWLH